MSGSGTVPLSADGSVDLDVSVDRLPLAVANAVAPDLALEGDVSGTASIAGPLTAPEGTFDVRAVNVSAAPLVENGIAPVDVAASGEIVGRTVELSEASLTNDQGIAATASGTVPLATDAAIDVDVSLDALPLSLGNAARPELALGGQVSGTASIAGTLTAPTGTFDIEGEAVTAAPLAENGIRPLDVAASGELTPTAVILDAARVTNDQGIAASASGTVPLATDGAIDIDVSLDAVPLSVANAARPDLGLGGTVSGTASVEGTLTAPRGTFDIEGTDIAAAALRSNGVQPLDVSLAGSSDGRTVTLDTARVTNDQGIAASASGTVPLSADGAIDIDVSLDAVPLSVANAARPDLGLGGTVSGTASVEGTLTAPRGTFDIEGTDVAAAALRSNGVRPLDVALVGLVGRAHGHARSGPVSRTIRASRRPRPEPCHCPPTAPSTSTCRSMPSRCRSPTLPAPTLASGAPCRAPRPSRARSPPRAARSTSRGPTSPRPRCGATACNRSTCR